MKPQHHCTCDRDMIAFGADCTCNKKLQHTPTPQDLNDYELRGALISAGYSNFKADEIVRAVNCHEELLHACKVAFDSMTSDKADGMPVGQILMEAIAKAEAHHE